VRRFEACIASPTVDVVYATQDPYLGDDRVFAYCSRLAMGLAALRARHLGAEIEQVAVWDGEPPTGVAGTAADVERWRRSGRPQTVISPRLDGRLDHATATQPAPVTVPQPPNGRLSRAMLFSDVRDYSRLTDADLPHFFDGFLRVLAAAVARYENAIDFANTWGDGLFLVFEDLGKAADCALDMQEAIAEVDTASVGLPRHLTLRVGGHFGPAYPAFDPFLKKTNYFGSHVTRAARIEPVVPEGCVYVTETFAAALALEHADRFSCEYVGMTETAKRYGTMRMFLLHRRRRRA
jgi:class 3 adenylate cyclase